MRFTVSVRVCALALDAELHERQKCLVAQQTRVAVVEQELRDKDQVLVRSSDLLAAEQQQRVRLNTLLFRYLVITRFFVCIQLSLYLYTAVCVSHSGSWRRIA